MKTRSTLPEQPFFVHVAALLDMIVILLIVTMASTKLGATHGIDIQLPRSQYVLAQAPYTVLLTVTGGDAPTFYLNKQRLANIVHLESALDKMKSDADLTHNQAQIFVVLRLDGSVNHALEQQLINIVLSRGMNCALAADPAS